MRHETLDPLILAVEFNKEYDRSQSEVDSVTQSRDNVAISYIILVLLIKVPIQKQQSSGIERRRGRRRIMTKTIYRKSWAKDSWQM